MDTLGGGAWLGGGEGDLWDCLSPCWFLATMRGAAFATCPCWASWLWAETSESMSYRALLFLGHVPWVFVRAPWRGLLRISENVVSSWHPWCCRVMSGQGFSESSWFELQMSSIHVKWKKAWARFGGTGLRQVSGSWWWDPEERERVCMTPDELTICGPCWATLTVRDDFPKPLLITRTFGKQAF